MSLSKGPAENRRREEELILRALGDKPTWREIMSSRHRRVWHEASTWPPKSNIANIRPLCLVPSTRFNALIIHERPAYPQVSCQRIGHNSFAD
jgi:hypothetical protein